MAIWTYIDASDSNEVKTVEVDSNNVHAAVKAIAGAGGSVAGNVNAPNTNITLTQSDDFMDNISVGESLAISGSAEVLSLVDFQLDRTYAIPLQRVGETDNEPTQELVLQTAANVEIQSVDTATSTDRSFSFSITVSQNRLIYSVISRAAEDSDNVEVIIRKTDANGPLVAYQDQVSVRTTPTDTVTGLSSPLRLTAGEVLHVTVSGALFKGDDSGSEFAPYFAVRSRNWALSPLSGSTVRTNFLTKSADYTLQASDIENYDRLILTFTNTADTALLNVPDGLIMSDFIWTVKHYSDNGGGNARIQQLGAGADIDGEIDRTINMDSALTMLSIGGNEHRIISSHSAIAPLVTLSNRSVTELNDVTDAGSGQIITSEERAKLGGLEETPPVLAEFANNIANPTHAQLRTLFNTAIDFENHELNSSTQVDIDFRSTTATSSEHLWLFWDKDVTIVNIYLESETVTDQYFLQTWEMEQVGRYHADNGEIYYVYKSGVNIGHGGGNFDIRIDFTVNQVLGIQQVGNDPADFELLVGTGSENEAKGSGLTLIEVEGQRCLSSRNVCQDVITFTGGNYLNLNDQAAWDFYQGKTLRYDGNDALVIDLPALSSTSFSHNESVVFEYGGSTGRISLFVQTGDTFSGQGDATEYRLNSSRRTTGVLDVGSTIWNLFTPSFSAAGTTDTAILNSLWLEDSDGAASTDRDVVVKMSNGLYTDNVNNHSAGTVINADTSVVDYEIDSWEAMSIFLNAHNVLSVPLPIINAETGLVNESAISTWINSNFYPANIDAGGAVPDYYDVDLTSSLTVIEVEFINSNTLRVHTRESPSSIVSILDTLHVQGISSIVSGNYRVTSTSSGPSNNHVDIDYDPPGASATNNSGIKENNIEIGKAFRAYIWQLKTPDNVVNAQQSFSIKYWINDLKTAPAVIDSDLLDHWLSIPFTNHGTINRSITASGGFVSENGDFTNQNGDSIASIKATIEQGRGPLTALTGVSDQDLDLTKQFHHLTANNLNIYYIDPSTLPSGVVQPLEISSDDSNAISDVVLAVGSVSGGAGSFDAGINAYPLAPNESIRLIAYNDGASSGVRISNKLSKGQSFFSYPSAAVLTSLTSAYGMRLLPLTNATEITAENQDPYRILMQSGMGSNNQGIHVRGDGGVRVDASVDLVFNGVESVGDFTNAAFYLFINGVAHKNYPVASLPHILSGAGYRITFAINDSVSASSGDILELLLDSAPSAGANEAQLNVNRMLATFTWIK